MSNYKETNISGTKWTRAKRIIIENPKDQIASILINEEDVIEFDTKETIIPSTSLYETFSDPSKSFNLLNPTDDSIIGSATYQEVYIMLYSLYIYLANQRDNT